MKQCRKQRVEKEERPVLGIRGILVLKVWIPQTGKGRMQRFIWMRWKDGKLVFQKWGYIDTVQMRLTKTAAEAENAGKLP